jgi:hypothetical protein
MAGSVLPQVQPWQILLRPLSATQSFPIMDPPPGTTVFARCFRPNIRPIAFPAENSVVNNACESTVYAIATSFGSRGNHTLSAIYSTTTHSQAISLAEPFIKLSSAPSTITAGAVAARALVFIEAANPSIGLMCFIAVGTAEMSTCEITVRKGDVIKKGDQIGMFHFGGCHRNNMFFTMLEPQYSTSSCVKSKIFRR